VYASRVGAQGLTCQVFKCQASSIKHCLTISLMIPILCELREQLPIIYPGRIGPSPCWCEHAMRHASSFAFSPELVNGELVNCHHVCHFVQTTWSCSRSEQSVAAAAKGRPQLTSRLPVELPAPCSLHRCNCKERNVLRAGRWGAGELVRLELSQILKTKR
jgi:hypothetical protein